MLSVLAAGLMRFAHALAVTMPLAVLLMYLGGVDARFVGLALAGAASTALVSAAVSVAASVESRTAARATGAATSWLYLLFMLPPLVLLAWRFFFPALPAWVLAPVRWAVDASPLGVLGGLAGVIPRPWGLAEGVARMAAMQVAAAAAATAWAAARLRPASRALHDTGVSRGIVRAARLARRTRPRRSPCGDDPVYWNEAHGYRIQNRVGLVVARLLALGWAVVLAAGTWVFAAPAFRELAERGYGASVGGARAPDINPLVRVLVERLVLRSHSCSGRH